METDTKSAPSAQVEKDAHATNDSSKSGESKMAQSPQPPAPKSYKGDPNKRIADALEDAMSGVPDADEASSLADVIAIDLKSFLNANIRKDIKADEVDAAAKTGDPCSPTDPKPGAKPDPKIAPFCNQRARSLAAALKTYNGSRRDASGALQTAYDIWTDAKAQYEFEMANADADFRTSVKAAWDAYDLKKNPDSGSRNHQLYFTVEEAIAVAVQSLESSAATAAGELAAAAGALLVAEATYVEAINAAQSQKMVDDATAQQVFWQSVEGVWDN